MKKIFPFLLFLSVFAENKAADKASLSGKITDKESGQAVVGARVYITELKTGAISKEDGTYLILNLPKAKVLVHVTMIGYKTISQTIDLSLKGIQDFILEPSIVEINTVVVTGTSKATELKKDPLPAVVIDRQYLAENPSTNIIEALNKVPGLSTLSTGPNVSKPYIHGLGNNRVLTLFDGVRQEGQQWGEEHGVEADQFLIDHIEVIKGPASLMYGSDALAGVVNLLPAPPLPEGEIKGSVMANYQTNNKGMAGSASVEGNKKGFIWGFRASHKQAADYQNKADGRVFDTKYDENDGSGYVGLNKAWGYSHLNFSLYDNLQEIPDGSRDFTSGKFTRQITEADTFRPLVGDAELNSYRIGILHQHVQHYRIYSSDYFVLPHGNLGVILSAQQSIRREFNHPENADIAGLSLKLSTYGYDFKYYLPEKKGWETTLGVNGMYQANDASKGTEFVIPSYRDFDLGPFVHLKKTWNKWTFSGGLRYDMRYFQNDSMFTKPDPVTGFNMTTPFHANDSSIERQFDYYRHTFEGWSGSLGASYNLADRLTVKVNAARGFRAPDAAEISARGIHPGTGFEQVGDASLEPEFSLQEDLGLFYTGEHVSAGVEAFNNNISNYIYDEKLQSTHGGDSMLKDHIPVFKFRQTEAQLTGGEISLDIHPHPFDWLHFENSLSYIYAINRGGNGSVITDSMKYLPLIPPLHTHSELKAEFKKGYRSFSSVFLKIGFEWYAAQNHYFGAYGTETYTPAYMLWNAGIGGDVVNKKRNVLFNWKVVATNLADAAYQSNMNRLKYFIQPTAAGPKGIYNMGRNISFALTVPLTFKKA